MLQYYNVRPRGYIIYDYYKRGAFDNLIISISAIVDEGAGIDADAKSLLHIAKFSPRIVWTSTVLSARRCVSHANRQWKDHASALFQR